MKTMLDSNLLRCFLSVMEHRKLTTAADELCITQPAMSKSLKRLEEELGVPLFVRTPAGMVPTTYGMALSRRARLIDLESKKARIELQVLREGGFGSLTIGIGPLWSVWGLPEAIADIVQRQSKVQVKIVSGVLDTLIPQLIKGTLDVVCAALDFPDHPDLVKEQLFESEHVILAHASHPLFALESIAPEHLCDYPFAGFADDYAGLDRMQKFFASHGLESPRFAVEASSLEMLLSLLRTGQFISSVAAQVSERGSVLGLKRLPLEGSFWHFKAGLIYRRSPQDTPLVGMLSSALKTHIAAQVAPA